MAPTPGAVIASLTRGIAPRLLAHLFLKAVQLPQQNLVYGKKRLGDCLKHRVMLRQLLDPLAKPRRGRPDLQAEARKSP